VAWVLAGIAAAAKGPVTVTKSVVPLSVPNVNVDRAALMVTVVSSTSPGMMASSESSP
jgi:hypothetical protein